MTEETKKVYPQVACDLCGLVFGSNYLYQHKRTAKHMNKANAVKVKEQLLSAPPKNIADATVDQIIADIEERLYLLRIKMKGQD